MAKVFSVEIQINATAYIRAESDEEALKTANALFARERDATVKGAWSLGDIPVTDVAFNSRYLPAVSLTTAMTFNAYKGVRSFTLGEMIEVYDGKDGKR